MAQRALSKSPELTQRTTLQDGSKCYRCSKFTQVLTRLAPGHVLVSAYGYNSGESAPLVTADLGYEIPHGGKLSAYVDLSHETGQASAAREWWAEWNKQHRLELNPAHILVRGKLMEMAISVLSMIVGGINIRPHSSEVEFISVISQAVPGFRQLPKYPDLPRYSNSGAFARPFSLSGATHQVASSK